MDFIRVKNYGSVADIAWGDGCLNPDDHKKIRGDFKQMGVQEKIHGLYQYSKESFLYSGALFGAWEKCPVVIAQSVISILEAAYKKIGSYPGASRVIDPAARAEFFPEEEVVTDETINGTIASLMNSLSQLSINARNVALTMADVGHFNLCAEMTKHAQELINAAEIIKSWSGEVEVEA